MYWIATRVDVTRCGNSSCYAFKTVLINGTLINKENGLQELKCISSYFSRVSVCGLNDVRETEAT